MVAHAVVEFHPITLRLNMPRAAGQAGEHEHPACFPVGTRVCATVVVDPVTKHHTGTFFKYEGTVERVQQAGDTWWLHLLCDNGRARRLLFEAGKWRAFIQEFHRYVTLAKLS